MLKCSNIIMVMYIVCKPIDIRISDMFVFGAISMPMDTFMGKTR
jgi:hypothetical protein